MTFNFSGIPGSDDEISFDSKKLSREVEEAIFVCDYIKKKLLKHSNDEHSEHQTRVVGRLHVVGLSTGAIIGGLIRSQLELNDTLTLIAGLLDLKRGLSYDFDEKQLKSFEEKGECLKEFWLCDQECPVPQRVQVIRTKDTEKTGKIYLPLAKAYRDEYLNGSLNIKDSVSGMQNTSKELCPLLVIHGDQDVFVPFENGQELFEASKIPKTFLHIPKANHLLTNSKHLARAIKEMSSHMKKGKKE
jgi:pimeloyl-ACP methyl ester carboxylesterase